MRFQDEWRDAINESYAELRSKKKVGHVAGMFGLELLPCVDGDKVVANINNYAYCNVEEISNLIDELTDMKNAIERETGLVL